MERNAIKTTPTGKTKIILVTFPIGYWEKFDALVKAAQAKMPGITHDMVVSTWCVDMIDRATVPPAPAPTVEAERTKLNEGNPS